MLARMLFNPVKGKIFRNSKVLHRSTAKRALGLFDEEAVLAQ
jgi:hypothetical protein